MLPLRPKLNERSYPQLRGKRGSAAVVQAMGVLRKCGPAKSSCAPITPPSSVLSCLLSGMLVVIVLLLITIVVVAVWPTS